VRAPPTLTARRRSGFGTSVKRLTATSRTRLELRNWNRRHVTELDEILQPLPRLDYGELPRDAPSTGRMVQRLDRKPCFTACV